MSRIAVCSLFVDVDCDCKSGDSGSEPRSFGCEPNRPDPNQQFPDPSEGNACCLERCDWPMLLKDVGVMCYTDVLSNAITTRKKPAGAFAC